ncbi:MAG: hypothetical protein ABJM11_00025 [Marinobacter sp.]|uniref:hypothetical protein n=1 Tax=Marinobacter sp. TaxID=50741 RepID=UPI0032993387
MERIESALIPRIRQAIADSAEVVFLPADFAELATDEQVGRAIACLVGDGDLVWIGDGLLAKARRNRITGETMLDASGGFDEVAKAGLTKLGIAWEPGRAESDYQNGGTQIPAKTVVRTDQRDPSCPMPSIRFGQYRLYFEPMS